LGFNIDLAEDDHSQFHVGGWISIMGLVILVSIAINLVINSDNLVFAAVTQSSRNIPIVVPVDTNVLSNFGSGGVAAAEANNDVLVLGKDKFNDTTIIPSSSTAETTELPHYSYDFNGSIIVDQAYTPLVNNRLGGNSHPSYLLDQARNQYIVLLKPAAVSTSSDSPILTQLTEDEGVEKQQQQKDRVRVMAAQAAREGGQVTRIYENLDGYAVRAPADDPRFVERLRNDPRVAHVEEDQIVYAMLQSLPTGINRIDADLSNAKSGDGTGSVNVDVAVLDSGIDSAHPDLTVYRSKTFVSGTSSAKDDNGHGTFVAGIIGAKDDDAGVVGVVPGARLWAVKVLDRSGNGLISDIIAGIDYIVQNAKEIDAANLSFGCECSSSALNSAINKAVSAGISFAVAAGNNAKNANSFSPANNPNVIAVSAITDSDGKCGAKGPPTGFGADDRLASFSNYGSTISIGAPGVEILTTSMNGGYVKVSGTSAAAPHAAGAAALYKAANPSATPSQVKSALISNAVKSSVSTCDGNGFGYFSGDKDTFREPLLYLKGMGPTSDSGNNAPLVNRAPTADSKSISLKANAAIDVILSGNDLDNDPISFSVVDLPKNGQLLSVSSNTVRYVPKSGFMGQDSFTYLSHDDKGASSTNKATVSLTVSQMAVCETLSSNAVIASGDDGNVPSNVLDNNLNTRWSNLGQGSWIQLDLGAKKSICSVDIAWYLGDQRQNNFVISVSDDGTTFTNKFSGTSSGATTSPEKYNMPAGTEGRYVRVTVNGNTQNEWASITEIAVFGGATSGGGGSNVIGTLFHKWQTSAGSNTWSSYASLSGAMAPNTDLAVAMNSDGRLQVFVVGTNNQLYFKTQTAAGSSTWSSSWTSLGGIIKADTSPAVARNSDGRLQVFVVGTNSELYSKTQTAAGSSTWSAWTSLGGTVRANTDHVVIPNSDGRLQVFVVSTNNALYYKVQTSPGSSTWSGWTSLGGIIKENTSPAVASNSDGRLEAFVIGMNSELYHKAQTSAGSSTWSSSWTSLGGGLRAGTDPVVIVNSDGRLQVFVVGTNNQLYYKTQASAGSSTWSSSWTSLGGGIKADISPAVARNNDGRLQVFVVGTNNQLYYKTQRSAGSSTWSSSWTYLGGTLRENTDPAVVPNSDGRLDAFVMSPTGPANQRPTADSKSVTTNINTPVDITLSGNDPDNDPITFSIVDQPTRGTLSAITSQNTVRYTPNTGYVGADSFTYIARDSKGATSISKASVSITVSSTDTGTNDKFGIKKMYATKSGGEEWYMNMPSPTNDPRFNSGGVSLTKNADGYSYKVESTQVRFRAFTSSGYNPNLITTLNQQQLATKGYMQSPNDWKNVEITGYFKVNSHTSGTANGGVHLVLSSRGGTHSSNAPCEGTAYHSNLYQTGSVKFQKELRHPDAYASNGPQKSGATNTLLGRGWFGFKAVVYTSPIDGSVKLEQYIDDTANNNWRKLLEFKDNGNNWFVSENLCGGTLGQMISWGGPWALFRWDNIDDMDIKDFSVREIVPSSV